LGSEISAEAEVDIQTIRVELDAQIAGRELTIPQFDDDYEADQHDLRDSTEPGSPMASFPGDEVGIHADSNESKLDQKSVTQ